MNYSGHKELRFIPARMNDTYLSLAFEYAGKITEPTGQVKITLPAGLVNGYTLSLLNADGTETPLEYALEGDFAVFTLTFAQPLLAVRLTPAP